jgi:hypothetical protein
MKTILMIIMGISLFAATAEADTIGNQVLWTAGCMAVMGASAYALNRIEKKEEQSHE